MEIKIELPGKDFKELADSIESVAYKTSGGFGTRVRKHKIENGQYGISVNPKEAYDHDEKKLTQNGKVEIIIKSINNGN